MAAAITAAAGQGISDGWAGWLVRRLLAAGWTEGDLEVKLERIPPRHAWPAELRRIHPLRAVLILAGLPWARHWTGQWVTAPPARIRGAREIRAGQRQRRAAEQAGRAAAAAVDVPARAAEARAALARGRHRDYQSRGDSHDEPGQAVTATGSGPPGPADGLSLAWPGPPAGSGTVLVTAGIRPGRPATTTEIGEER